MAQAVIMPRQGQSVESCILTQWFREVGEEVSKGDLLFAYETDKAAFEEEAPEDGVLLARYFEEGDEVPVLSNVAVIGKKGESADDFAPGTTSGVAASGAETSEAASTAAAAPTAPGSTEASGIAEPGTAEAGTTPVQEGTLPDVPGSDVDQGRVAISPRARKLAKEKRVMIGSIQGSGPGGRIIERDVVAEIRSGKRLTPLAQKKLEGSGYSVPSEGKSPYGRITSRDLMEPGAAAGTMAAVEGVGPFEDLPLTNVRKIIASAMHRSLQNSAQLTHHLSANASRMLLLRKEVKKRMEAGYRANVTLNDMVSFAVIRALRAFPEANAHFLGEKIRRFRSVNLGMAVDTDRGLLVPSLPGADELTLEGLSLNLKKLVEDTRTGKVSPDLLAPEAASFTISNLGNYGVEMFTPVINLPQVAILGVNTILYRPAVLEDGTFGFQPFIGLSLTYDHRAIDGGPATRFLAEIKNQVEQLSTDLL
ncbi:MAG: dihydrolipoamide acetyltransferase family protein [Bacteroidales bacterium]